MMIMRMRMRTEAGGEAAESLLVVPAFVVAPAPWVEAAVMERESVRTTAPQCAVTYRVSGAAGDTKETDSLPEAPMATG